MAEEESTGYLFTIDGTKVDQETSHFENGILFPDGSSLWRNDLFMRGYELPKDSAPTEQEQAKLQELHARNLRNIGVAPNESLRLSFVRRAVVISYGQAEAVPEWL